MRILKSFPMQDQRAELISKIFDSTITKFSYPWHFDSLELHIRDENKIVINNDKCLIILDYNDMFVQEEDRRGIATLITRLMFKAVIREMQEKLPEIIEDIVANREMIRKGHGDDLVYFYFQKNLGKKPGSIREELVQDIAWLSFWRDDRYNAEFLRKNSSDSAGLHKLLGYLREDLDDKEKLSEAIGLYYALERKGFI